MKENVSFSHCYVKVTEIPPLCVILSSDDQRSCLPLQLLHPFLCKTGLQDIGPRATTSHSLLQQKIIKQRITNTVQRGGLEEFATWKSSPRLKLNL